MNDTIITARGLSLSYGTTVALDGMDVSVPANGIVGLIGRNGSGKTTFLKLCAGLLHPVGGGLSVFGAVPEDDLSVLTKIVYAVPDREYTKGLRLNEIFHNYEVMFPRFDMDFAANLMNYFDLGGRAKYSGLSRGMAATFNFICAISCRAELTLFDEIVLGMDVPVRGSVYEILLREYSEHPRTFIVSSHLFAEVETILSDVILLDKGKTVLHSDIDELRRCAYRVTGEQESVRSFTEGKKIVYNRAGELGGEAVVMEALGDGVRSAAQAMGLTVSGVMPEELCFALVGEDKEEVLSCLWNA